MNKRTHQKKIKYLIGIDEVGRGPLAGPVSVCICIIPYHKSTEKSYERFLKAHGKDIKKLGLPDLSGKDSKKLTPARREAWKSFLDASSARFIYGSMTAPQIDRLGIAVCISRLIDENLGLFMLESGASVDETLILLDGGLKAPMHFGTQKTIVRGDEKELVISLASIFAKVTRDSYMKRISKKPGLMAYGFHIHKGYGTARHRAAIRKEGPSKEHRGSFLKRIMAD